MQIGKAGIDLGIVVRNVDAMLAFYRDTLGLYDEGALQLPGDMVMHRLWAAETMIKLVSTTPMPDAANPPGGLSGASGMRYFTFTVTNLDEVHDVCVAAGVTVVVAPLKVAPNARIAMYEDPDGNHVELLEHVD